MPVILYRNLTSTNYGTNPFWGTPTATVDWCEINYEKSRFVAEWNNTFSSFLIVLVGLIGSWMHRSWLPLSFHLAFGSTALVGIGSIAYHSTLLRETQALDEVPMLFSAMCFFYICVNILFDLLSWQKTVFGILGFIYSIVLGYQTAVASGEQQFMVFHLSFGLLEISSLFMCCYIYRLRRLKRMGNKVQPSAYCFERGILCYVCAIFFWMVEVNYCEYLNPGYVDQSILPINPQLHTFWHVLVSLGLHQLALFLLIEYLEKGKKGAISKAQMNWIFSGIPYVKIKNIE